MFPAHHQYGLAVVRDLLGLVLAYWMACDYPRMHHEICTIIGQGEGDLVPLYGRHPFSLCRRLHARYGRDVYLRWFPRLYRFYDHRASVCGAHGYLYRHHAFGSGRRSRVSAAIATVLGFMFSPMLALWTLIVTMVAQNVTDNVISPKVMQSSVQVHPIMSLTALVIGSALMGPIGMIIAIPLCAALKGIFVYYFENETGRQLVAHDDALCLGTPYRDADQPGRRLRRARRRHLHLRVRAHRQRDCARGQGHAQAELDNPWIKLSGLQPDATGFFKNPFAKDDDSNLDDDTKTGIDGSMDDDDN